MRASIMSSHVFVVAAVVALPLLMHAAPPVWPANHTSPSPSLKRRELSIEELAQPAIDPHLVELVNSNPASTWRAGISWRFHGLTLADVVMLCGVRDVGASSPDVPHKIYNDSNAVDIPVDLDWRKMMGDKCPSINRIRDQANCGSCWAFGSVEVMESRMCIQSNGAVKHQLSEQDLVSCVDGNGCSGGQPLSAWKSFQSPGIVTGGAYADTAGGCYPYGLPPCNHHTQSAKYPNCPVDAGTPTCNKTCVDGEDYEAAKIRNANTPYTLSGADALEQELQKGPITVIFNVLKDFPAYKSGIYDPAWPPVILGGHAVAIYGYGEDNGTPYWLVKNSWNEAWGENGWFRIVKGKNAAWIESGISSSQMPCAADVKASVSRLRILDEISV